MAAPAGSTRLKRSGGAEGAVKAVFAPLLRPFFKPFRARFAAKRVPPTPSPVRA